MKVRVFAENLGEMPCSAELVVIVEKMGQHLRFAMDLKPGMNSCEAQLVVQDPYLWWPVGHGDQTRYLVKVLLHVKSEIVGKDSRKVGFRHVRINQDFQPVKGKYFVMEINGKPIFCKGGNYVPTDVILSRIGYQKHEVLIERASEANCNFLRVWGGEVYESDDFYELCDARGIMVWQDFIFACCKYPTTNESFLADVVKEATHQVRRSTHHPSLVVWCGNNEIEWGCWE